MTQTSLNVISRGKFAGVTRADNYRHLSWVFARGQGKCSKRRPRIIFTIK